MFFLNIKIINKLNKMKGRKKMKKRTTLALLAGVVCAAPVSVIPAFADEARTDMKQMDSEAMKDEGVNPKSEAFKKFVNEALDAHKGKAPKGMKGQHDAMKAYVGKALDAQMAQEKKMLGDTSDLDVKGSLTYLFNDAVPSSLPDLAKCFTGQDESKGDQVWYTWAALYGPCMQPLVKQQVESSGVLKFDWETTLQLRCTSGWPLISHGTCENPKFQAACIIINNSSDQLSPKLTEHCSED